MIDDTSNSNFPPPPTKVYPCLHWVGIGKLEKGVQPPHSRGGVDADRSETAAVAASISKDAANMDTAN